MDSCVLSHIHIALGMSRLGQTTREKGGSGWGPVICGCNCLDYKSRRGLAYLRMAIRRSKGKVQAFNEVIVCLCGMFFRGGGGNARMRKGKHNAIHLYRVMGSTVVDAYCIR